MRTVHELSPVPTPPHDPVDAGRHQSFGGAAGTIDFATWLPTETSPGVISVTWAGALDGETEHVDRANVPYGRVRTAWALARMGLAPAMETLGFSIERVDRADEGRSFYTLVTPEPRAAVAIANTLEYPPELGRRMRFQIFEGDERYKKEDFFPAIKRGVMLIGGGSDAKLNFHDMVDHMLVGLSVTEEMLTALAANAEMLENQTGVTDTQRHAHMGHFMGQYDYLMYGPNFVRFLNQDRKMVYEWAVLLGVDTQTAAGWAQNARQQLSQLHVVGTNFRMTETSGRHGWHMPARIGRALAALGFRQTVK